MAGAVSSVFDTVKGLFAKPKIDKPAPPMPMPDLDSPAAKLAAKKKLQERSKAGRAGTIYSDAYSGTNLGGTA